MSSPPASLPHAADGPGRRLAFAAVVLAMLPAVLDQTVLATALPSIAADLGRLTDVSWIVSAYVVAAAAATPLWGKLGDRRGRARMLQLSLALFLACSAVCGLAGSLAVLVPARAAQGVAAGGLMTLAYAVVGDLVSPRERGRYQGYITAAFAIATVIGPLAGGLLVEHASWRWVFYVNLPLGLLALLGLRRRVPHVPGERGPARLDIAGAALLAAATTALLLACLWGGSRYPWGSATVLGLLGACAVLTAALIVRERRAADPIVPLGILRRRPVAVASAGLFLVTATMFAITVFVPLFLQVTTGATPTAAGLLLIPLMLGVTVSTNVAGRRIERSGRYRRFPLAGLGLIALALATLAVVAARPSRAATAGALVVFGVGFGMVGQVLTIAVQNAVDRRELGVAMATTTFFRALGGASGAAALGAVFTATAGSDRHGIIAGSQAVWITAAGIALVALAVVARLQEVPLQGAPERVGPAMRRPDPQDPAQLESQHVGRPARLASRRV